MTSLPWPFQDSCNFPGRASTSCYNECLLQQTKHRNRLPARGLWTDCEIHSHLKLESSIRVPLDEAYPREDELSGIEESNCTEALARVDCARRYIALHKIVTERAGEFNENVTVTLPWLPSIQITMENRIKIPVREYFNQVGGILGIWLGFSVYPALKKVTSSIVKCVCCQANSRTTRTRTRRPAPTEIARWRKILNFLMKLAIWAITFYLIVRIALIYLDRPFKFSFIAEVPKTVELPGVSVCFDMVIHPAKVKQMYPHVYATVPAHEWRNTLTIEQLFHTTTEMQEVFNPRNSYYLYKGCKRDFHRGFNFTKSINGKLVCFTTFRPQESLRPDFKREVLRSWLRLLKIFVYRLNQRLLKINQ